MSNCAASPAMSPSIPFSPGTNRLLAEKLAALNRELAEVGDGLRAALVDKLIGKHREEGVGAVTDADIRRWLLPDTHPARIKSAPARIPFKGVTARQVERYREKDSKGRVEGVAGAVRYGP